ncbi:DNA polymerase III subunit beta [Flocculibacter collagenilyticus]|uniref:DNA polymerase III subunit beta n=1 Tax=Flocculibacter collagenilyticus TaxID=2744479 RepID=UPI0018F4EB0B|nr:DNA polymerase III subunit beta [Flocculibacter collagenilyticus]
MQITLDRDAILKPLMLVSGAIERKHTLPILSNVLINVSEGSLSLTGTDLEVEMVAASQIDDINQEGAITVPAKKLLDICRSLPDGCQLNIRVENDSLILQSGKSRFSLSTLPATEYPNLESWEGDIEFQIERQQLRKLLDATQFSMANQDVRYYLNGMSFEVEGQTLRTVATDGHRLALATYQLNNAVAEQRQVIIPRKGVLEIMRLLESDDTLVTVQMGTNHIRLVDNHYVFTSKLVDGRFPDYRRVIPRNGDKFITADKDDLRAAFNRASILSNEKFRGVRLNVTNGELQITANNPEQEQAEESVGIQYAGPDIEIGFNVSYILDVLGNIKEEQVVITLIDGNSSALIEAEQNKDAMYVVMPMRL